MTQNRRPINLHDLLDQISPAFFAPVMGTAGLGIAWRIAAGPLPVPTIIGEGFVVLAFAVFSMIACLFILKGVLNPASMATLWRENSRLVFLPMIPTSGLLLSIGARPYDIEFATVLWQISAPFNLLLSLVLVGRWLFDDHEVADILPAWMFPVVGNGVVPIAGVALGFVDASWTFFAISFVLWVLVFAMLFARLVLGGSLTIAARPTMLILISPPSTFFIAYFELTGGRIDLMAHSMIYFSIFLFTVFLLNIRWFTQAPFSIASWSLTFPMAALTIATLLFFRATSWTSAQWLSCVFLTLTTFFVLGVYVASLRAIIKSLCHSRIT